MTNTYHELDPDGDVYLICGASALVTEGSEESTVDPKAQEHTTPTTVESPSDTTQESQKPTIEADNTTSDPVLHIRVSSRHLTLASRVFKALLQTRFKEGKQLSSDGRTELLFPDDNGPAFLVLLNIMHGKFRSVPRKVTISMLTELAILVDKYELLETTDMLMKDWFRGLGSGSSIAYTYDILPLMCISWVFQRRDLFKEVTKRAQLETEGILETEKLPIPGSVLNDINRSRQDAIAQTFSYLQAILKLYRGNERICPQGLECDGMVLGSLIIGLKAIDILQPPLPPYNGLSVRKLFRDLTAVDVRQYCVKERLFGRSDGRICKGVKEALANILQKIEQKLQGLSLINTHGC